MHLDSEHHHEKEKGKEKEKEKDKSAPAHEGLADKLKHKLLGKK